MTYEEANKFLDTYEGSVYANAMITQLLNKKEEKVVKPPQNPTLANNINADWFSLAFLNKYPVSNPINKQPITLA
jgi:hypothetical protein